jgi:hypothetical protein
MACRPATTVGHVRLVLSLFPARPVSQGVPRGAGPSCCRGKWPAPIGCIFILALLLWGEGAHAQAPFNLGFRVGQTGAWTVGLSGKKMRPAQRHSGELRSSIVLVNGGVLHWSAAAAVPVDADLRAGAGWHWAPGKSAALVLALSGRQCAAKVDIPWLQPAAQPVPSRWWCGCAFDAEQWDGMATITWSAGQMPVFASSLRGGMWECGVGSQGCWLARILPHDKGGLSLKLSVGVLRGNIPWSGADVGDYRGLGAHPGRWMEVQWLAD